MTTASERPRWAPWATGALAAAITTVFGLDVVLGLTMPASVPSDFFTPLAAYAPILPFTALGIVAVVVVHAQPRNLVSWLLAGIVLAFPATNLGGYYVEHWLYKPDLPSWPLVPLGLSSALLTGLTALPVELLPYYFPDGRLVSRRWRPAVWLTLAATLFGVVGLLDPHVIGDGHRFVHNPIGVTGISGLLGANGAVSLLAWFGLGFVGLGSLVVRYRRAGAEQRQQIKWFGVGLMVLVLSIAGGIATETTPQWTTPAPIAFEILGFGSLPLCVAVAVLRYRLYDIDIVINRALVYGALAAFITAVYVAIVVGLGSVLGQGSRPNLALSIVATAIVAAAFHPARERLQRIANRLVYGTRATPYEVLAAFSGRVAETYAADDVLARMARVLAEATGAVSAGVWLRAGHELRPAAWFPPSQDGLDTVPITGQLMPALPGAGASVPVRHRGELLGALQVRKRAAEAVTPMEEKLLEDLANQAGVVLKNVGLTADLEARLVELQASRQRLVQAQDDERRRLERNLHDGAQQNLVALKVRLGLAKTLARTSPAKAKELLEQLKDETDDTLETLRDLARGIYPPLLAEKGLVTALEAQARKATVPITVEAHGVGRYPQEVEAAAYFCCLEALQNVQKYAGASRAVVRLAGDEAELAFTVEDDGVGFDPATAREGMGLGNIRDRLEALGGKLELRTAEPHGAVITGRLPLAVGVAP